MSIRHLALYIVVGGLSIYAWKDWFKSLCGLILLMAVTEHESMPKSMFGIHGLNMWNVLFFGVLAAWLAGRRHEGLTWDMPRHISVLLLMYVGVILVGVLRAALDRSHLEGYPVKRLISEDLFNTLKWVVPGVLLFDGCRTRRRLIMAVVCLLAMYSLIAVQVVRRLPAGSVLSAGGDIDRTRNACDDIGYGACDMSTFLAGACWGIVSTLPLVRRKRYKVLILAAAGIVAFGQALTGGRAGYVAWGATGLTLCLLKWRKYLILTPVVVMLLPIVFPGVVNRMLQGFGATDAAGQTAINEDEVGSGRFLLWPIVIDKIAESPLLGYGRRAMQRTGLYDFTAREMGEALAHPHNMYLETLLDNGIFGTIPILLFWGTLVLYSGRLFRSSNRLCSTVGGVALSLMLAQLIAGLGSQHFYPRESTLGVWGAMCLAVRVYVEQSRVREDATVAEGTWTTGVLAQRQAVIPAVGT